MLLKRDFSDILKQLKFKKGKIKAILDTDTYNEIDDQFALVQMLFSREKIDVQSINAAPFSMNNRSDNPKKGMELSYDEIIRLLEKINFKKKNLKNNDKVEIVHFIGGG